MSLKHDLWENYTRSAKQFMRLKNWREAERMFRSALQTAELMGPADPHVGASLNSLAHMEQRRGRYDEAEGLFRRALDLAVTWRGPDHVDAGVTLANLANLYQAREAWDQARRTYREALGILEAALGPDHAGLARVLENYASLLEKQGDGHEAAVLRARARRLKGDAAAPPSADE
jgi:tetratricopeptide (TPR) repeat protein